ncbi:endoribonuclease Ysh1p [Trichomonascus vanleenenianus]|uniref:cleavage polyadenylation factor subunit YSH1 n=1 Tax=Trichomonascus vanleenenianus TaxID=2268995 RepID=UPI003ECA7EC4
MAAKRPSEDEPVDDFDKFEFVALGGGNEVGRSCHIISYKGKTIMLDAGVHPAYSGMASLPFYDEYDLSTVDILLISHFHLDHAASLPYVMQHTNFKGRVFMTHPTKAIYRWLLADFVKVSADPDSAPLYTEEDLNSSFYRIEAIDFHSTMEVNGIKFTAYHAGHVLGAAMYLIEIGGVKVLFTGDYSREEDRHLNQAEVPPQRPDILITESTYGTATHRPRAERETRLTQLIHSTIQKGGRCLLPVFALGRAQEILLILDEYWGNHQDLEGVPIYYASALARRCMAVFQTYTNMMNDNFKKKFRDAGTNPFLFKHIKNIRSLDRFDDFGPSVMVAAPGMLQNGVSRELLERWAPDPKNILLLTGYSVEGTMAKSIINEPTEIPSVKNPEVKIPRRLQIEELSFAAHVDFVENSGFIELVNPHNIILVHGEHTNMGRLKSALMSKYSDRKGTEHEVKIYNPKNCYELEIPFKSVKVARVTGALADKPPGDGKIVSGVLVEKDFHLKLLHVKDLREYAGLTTSIVTEKQTVIVDAGPDLIKYHLQQMFGDVEVSTPSEEVTEFLVMGTISIVHSGHKSTIEWEANVMNDAIADSVLAVLLSVDSSPASVKLSSCSCSGKHADTSTETRITRIAGLLRAQFGDGLELAEDKKTATITMDGKVAVIKFDDLSVECPAAALKNRVVNLLERAVNTVAPLAQNADKLVELS